MFTVYVIQSQQDDGYYIGYTSDLPDRLGRHNKGLTRTTRGRGPWVLRYSEELDAKGDAIRREKQLKRQKSKAFLESLIAGRP